MAILDLKHTENLTIMMIDLCGYTKLSSKLKRETLHTLHDVFDELTISSVNNYHGNIIKKIGDAFLITFKSPTNALHSSIEIQEGFRNYNKKQGIKKPIKVRIGLHTGEVVFRKGDIYGDAVNICARIEKITLPGRIFFSNSVFMAMNKNEIPYKKMGLKKVKGVKYPIKLYKVNYHPGMVLRKKRKPKNFLKDLFWLGILLLIIYSVIKLIFSLNT